MEGSDRSDPSAHPRAPYTPHAKRILRFRPFWSVSQSLRCGAKDCKGNEFSISFKTTQKSPYLGTLREQHELRSLVNLFFAKMFGEHVIHHSAILVPFGLAISFDHLVDRIHQLGSVRQA